ncbi:unnamed protein product, partial [Dovyalis caffra]
MEDSRLFPEIKHAKKKDNILFMYFLDLHHQKSQNMYLHILSTIYSKLQKPIAVSTLNSITFCVQYFPNL